MKELLKTLSSGLSVFLILVLMMIALGAMMFTDDGDDILDSFFDKKQAVTNPMELRGDWLGMSLVDLNATTALRRNIPTSQKGVLVAELSETRGLRAQQAGIMPGDVITGINSINVRNISDVFEATRKINVVEGIFVNVVRWGQLMTLVLPAIYQPLAMMPQVQAGTVAPQAVAPLQAAAPFGAQAVVPQAAAPFGAQAVMPQAAALNAQGVAQVQTANGPLWICPRHGLGWYQRYVEPNFRCPICNGPLTQVP